MVGSTHWPDYVWTLVCTDPAGPRHQNLSWIFIPTNLPGITIQPFKMMMGIKNSVFFDNMRVTAFYLVGGENQGWKVAETHLELEHGGAGGLASNPLVGRVASFCRENKWNGQPLIKDQAVRDILADMFIEADISRLLAMRNFWLRNTRQPHSYEGPQLRYHDRVATLRMAERMQQIVGYSSLVADLSVPEAEDFEYLTRKGPGALHGGGTLDTDRLIIARRMGLGRTVREEAAVTI